MERVLILGVDGYIGWPLACRLLDHGIDVYGIDHCGAREYRGRSVTPIATHPERHRAASERFDGTYYYDTGLDVTRYRGLRACIDRHDPDAIVNLAQIPSAPYSMRGPDAAWEVQRNNTLGALNLMWALHDLGKKTPVVQLATMGEYPVGVDIPEGFLPDGRPAPKEPGSLYHASKVHMTVNTLFLSRLWDIPVTECYQGIVYGVDTDATRDDPALRTRFDADATFGTVLNRFTAQAAVGHPLTVYGDGGQKRAMLSLQDSIRCIHLLLENPPEDDPYRAVNQFDAAHRVRELADMVAEETGAEITRLENPRVEDDSAHAYDPEREVLDSLGFEPSRSIREEFKRTYAVVREHRDRVDTDQLRPRTGWTTADV